MSLSLFVHLPAFSGHIMTYENSIRYLFLCCIYEASKIEYIFI